MKKRCILLIIVLLIGSFVCLLVNNGRQFFEWMLLATLFGVALFFLGFTTRKREEKRASIIELLQEGVVILDWDGVILEMNQKGKALLGSISVGDPLFKLEMMKGFRSLFHILKETRIPQKGTAVGEKRIAYFELKILEARKRVLATFNDRYEHYQKQQLGKDFVANASHELRTPITIIKGFAETIYDLPKISEAMLHDFTEKIMRNCERMEGLVKNLLTLADLDYLPKAKMQECDLVGLIENCSQTLLGVYPKIQIESLHNREEIIVDGDPDLLELAVMNLLENAIKYSHLEALITVTIEDQTEVVSLKIADRGVGIEEEELGKIFERFYTVNKSHSRQMGGAGLGLSIVKTIVSKHEAEIDVTSTPGSGTAFTITFEKTTSLLR